MAVPPDERQKLQDLEALLNAAIPEFRWSGEINLKLERIQCLVELLGNPQSRYRIVHVGGTSGKGTVAAMTAAILSSHGQRTGLHLSPFVETLTETWQLDGRCILPSRVLPVARRFHLKPGAELAVDPRRLDFFEAQAGCVAPPGQQCGITAPVARTTP